MRKSVTLFILAALLLLSILPWGRPALADSTTVDSISGELMCQCGCTMIVSTCDCGTASQMRGVIQAKLDEGQGRDGILQYFVGQYGEKVLAAPTKQGFNLTAWITPFVALVAGLGILYLIVRTWVLKRRQVADEVLPAYQSDLTAYDDRIERELEQFG